MSEKEIQKTKTVIEKSEYMGKAILTIYPLDENGNKITKQLIGFGKKKAEGILEHIEEIKKFVESK